MLRERISDPSYQAMTGLLRRWIGHDVDRDLDALGVLVLGALVNVHRSVWTLGGDPAGVPEDQILSGWADLCVDVVKSVG